VLSLSQLGKRNTVRQIRKGISGLISDSKRRQREEISDKEDSDDLEEIEDV